MPMIVYTDEEVIEKCDQAEADGARRIAESRDRAEAESKRLRETLMKVRNVELSRPTPTLNPDLMREIENHLR